MILDNTLRSKEPYRGRFAPTPSGPLHLGSMLTALASFLVARHAGGAWLLRIDDLDRARCPAGTEQRILRQLEAHGLLWDETPRRQSEHLDEYRTALEALDRQGLLYVCTCTRQELKQGARHGPDGPIYPGTCSKLQRRGRGTLRVRVPTSRLCFDDGWLGRQCRNLGRDVGDFVVRRANGEFAYQLACSVDEAAQRVTEVVRGADLLGSTFQQRYLQEIEGLHAPRYRHLGVLVDANGRKLSKQNHASAVVSEHAPHTLLLCLGLLGQQPPQELLGESVEEVLRWAISHWDAAKVPRTAQIIPYNAVQQSPTGAP